MVTATGHARCTHSPLQQALIHRDISPKRTCSNASWGQAAPHFQCAAHQRSTIHFHRSGGGLKPPLAAWQRNRSWRAALLAICLLPIDLGPFAEIAHGRRECLTGGGLY